MEHREDSILPDELQKQLRAWALLAKVMVEVGSCPGRTAESLLTSSTGVLFMVDDAHPFGQAKTRLRERLKTHFDNGRAFMLDLNSTDGYGVLRRILAYRFADLIFIDNYSTLNQLEMDIFNYCWLLSTGGRMCGRFQDTCDFVTVLDRVLPGWTEENGLYYKVMS